MQNDYGLKAFVSPSIKPRSWGISGDSVFDRIGSGGWIRSPGIRDFQVVSPWRMIAQADASRFGEGRFGDSFSVSYRLNSIGFDVYPFSPEFARRHSGQVNVLFADGHVGSETLRQLLYPSVENLTRFNFDNRQHWNWMPSAEGWKPPSP